MQHCVAASNGIVFEFQASSRRSQDLWIGILGAYWKHPHFKENTPQKLLDWLLGDLCITAQSVVRTSKSHETTDSDADFVDPSAIEDLKDIARHHIAALTETEQELVEIGVDS